MACQQKSLDSGDVEEFINKMPAITFIHRETLKMFKKSKTLSLPSPVRASMTFGCIGIALCTRELWKLDWIGGDSRTCRIQSVYNESLYWYCLNKSTKGDHLIVTNFKKEEDNTLSGLIDNKKVKPSTFQITIVGDCIALQHVASKLWLSVKKEEIKLQDSFTDICQFYVGSKIGIFKKTSTSITGTLRTFMTTTTQLWGNRLYLQNLWPDRNSIFLIIPQSTHYIILSCKGTFIGVKNDQLVLTEKKKASFLRLQFAIHGEEIRLLHLSEDKSSTTPIVPDSNHALSIQVPGKTTKEDNVYFITYIPEKSVGSGNFEIDEEDDESSLFQEPPTNPVFGVPVPEILAREGTVVPLVIQHSVQFLRKHYESEGLFRLSGSKKIIEQLRNFIDYGDSLQKLIDKCNAGPDEVSGLLKLYISESRLFSKEIVASLSNIAKLSDSNQLSSSPNVVAVCGDDSYSYLESQRSLYRDFMQNTAPKYLRDTFGYLCKFFHELAKFSSVNKMGVSNIAIVIVPNLYVDYFSFPKLSAVFQACVYDYYAIFE